MTSALATIAIDARDPRAVADFWCRVLGLTVLESDGEVVTIGPPDGDWPTIDVCRVPGGKSVKNRLHFDIRADGIERTAELERLRALGARPADVGQPPDVTWTVLADPEGNEFCLLGRTVQEAAAG